LTTHTGSLTAVDAQRTIPSQIQQGVAPPDGFEPPTL